MALQFEIQEKGQNPAEHIHQTNHRLLSMLDVLRNKWNQLVWGNQIGAVHVHLKGEETNVTGILVERNGSRIDLLDTLNPTDELESLKRQFAENTPVVLVVTGKGIITKRLPRNHGGEQAQIKEQLDEFGNTEVRYSTTIQDNWIYLNIIRDDLVTDWFNKLEEVGIQPLYLKLGPSTAWEALQFLDGSENEVDTGAYRLVFDHAGLSSIHESDATAGRYLLGGDSIAGESLLSYACVISFVRSLSSGFNVESLKEKLTDEYYRRATKRAGMIGIASIFVVLLANAGFFMHYHERHQQLEANLFEYQGKLAEVEMLQQELSRKSELTIASGTETHGRFALYADLVASVLGDDIRLSRLTVNPIQPKTPRSDRITVKMGLLEVKGVCQGSVELDYWVKALDELEEVESVNILDFSQKQGGRENEFELEIIMNG